MDRLVTHKVYLAPLTLVEYLEAGKLIHTDDYRRYDEPTRPIPSLEDEHRFWKKEVETNHYLVMGIHLRADDSLVGYINAFDFNDRNQSCESGIDIFPPANFGKGYAFAAYRLFLPLLKKNRKIKTVNILTHPLNERAQNLYLKLGFVHLGLVPDEKVTWVKMSFTMK